MQLWVNGREVYTDETEGSLLDFLRNSLQLTAVKNGCAPQGACGACTVEIDGKATLACTTLLKRMEGKQVVTPEGLSPHVRETFAEAFAQAGGLQCGFCTPGIVMRAQHLLKKNPAPSREELAAGLELNLCRCTGYTKILDAIQLAAPALSSGDALPPREVSGQVGTPLAKVNARAYTLGDKPYVADLTPETAGPLMHASLRFSDHPRARVLRIQTANAAAVPGVERIVLATDVPGQRRVGLLIPDWPLLVAEGEETHYVGDALALVLASSARIARSAAALIEVEYEVLTPLLDPEEALLPSAPVLQPKGNLLGKTEVRKGRPDEAFAQCAFVTEGTWETQRIEHGFLEPECALAEPRPGGVKVFSQGQGVYEDRRQLALLLGLSQDAVEVQLLPSGGGFGGKEDLTVQGHAALGAWLLKAPVRLELTREESMRMHPKRHPIQMKLKLGCDAQGRLLALKGRFIGDSGAYASVGAKVLERAAGHATGAYDIPHVEVDALAVYTNNVPCGAMRGFGANQANFALECAIDDLCRQGGFDRWQLRFDNALTEGRATATGQVLKGGVGLRKTLLAVRDAFQSARYAGIACGLKNTGIGNGVADEGRCKISILGPQRIQVSHGWTEMGQGCDTIAVHTVCQETGLPPSWIEVVVDTKDETRCGMTTASRATSLLGSSLLDACKKLNAELSGASLEALQGRVFEGRWVCDWTTAPEDIEHEVCTHYSYSYATQVVILDDEGRLKEVIAAHDAGRIYNPTLFEGQIEGSVHMGLGYALTEELPAKDGWTSHRLRDAGILRARQMPRITVLGVEEADPHGPYGAKGVGEIGLVPTAPAVANALRAFDGHPRFRLPLKEDVLPRRPGI